MSEEFNQGLIEAQQRHGSEVQTYIDTKHLARPQLEYTPFEVVPKQVDAVQAVVAIAKPLAALTAVGVAAATAVSVAASVVSATLAFVAANAMYIGGGVFALTSVVLGISALFGSSEKAKIESGAPPTGGEWEFFQSQEQGWRKRT